MSRDTETAITIPAEKGIIKPYIKFVESYGMELSVEDRRLKQFTSALSDVLNLIAEDNARAPHPAEISINSKHNDGAMIVEVINHGRPLFLEQAHVKNRLSRISDLPDQVSFENRGRRGQLITFKLGLGADKDFIEDAADAVGIVTPGADEQIEIRRLRDGEEAELSRLFYSVYGYNYINEFVYFPEKMKKMREEENLISLVAVMPDGRLVGHVGLIRWNRQPVVYEAALGVVDPTVKSRGLFSQIFHQAMETLKSLPMQYCVFDFVTNHDFSQRLVNKYNSVDMALYLGNQISETQAKLEHLGLGEDPHDTDRYSLLVGVRPQVTYPFGKDVTLPVSLGEPCEFILKPLNVSWIPAPRFYPLPVNGEYRTTLQKEQRSAIFDFYSPGRKALEALISEWHQLLRDGYQYFAVDFPLNMPGIGQTYDILSKHGFFMAGFIPWHFGEVLGFRLQFLIPTKVNFNEIKVHSETGKKLLKMVREDYERNQIL